MCLPITIRKFRSPFGVISGSSLSSVPGRYHHVLISPTVYLLGFTVGVESNIKIKIKIDSDHKADTYRHLITNLRLNIENVSFINPFISALGIFGSSADSFPPMLEALCGGL